MRRITHIRIPQPLINPNRENLFWALLDDQDRVISVNVMNKGTALSGENWHGDWLSPMGLDLQINGGLGLAFNNLTFQDLPKLRLLLDHLWADGVEAICPTLVSCETSVLRQSLEVLREARLNVHEKQCALLGAHLEGPFLEKTRCGAHNPEYLCSASLSALAQRIGGFEEEISIVTLAPELNGAEELIRSLRANGIVISLGHSQADAKIASRAFHSGISMLTHAFNAMPGIHHRSPGPVLEAIVNGDIAIGLIADGVHVHSTIAVMLQKLASEQLVLVSDALAPYGLEDGQYAWDKRWMNVHQGTCRLEDGTLVGVTLPLLEGCIRLASWGSQPSASIWAATIAPRIVVEKRSQKDGFLLGKSLKNLLRWRCNRESKELSWCKAA